MPTEMPRLILLDTTVNVRVTSAEKAQLKEAASIAGLTVSSYLRRRALGRQVVANADAAMLRELRRMGGLLKHIYVDSGGVYSSETSEALAAVRVAMERLGRR